MMQRIEIKCCPTDSFEGFQENYDSLLRGLEQRILEGAMYAAFQYLALCTEYTVSEWFKSKAKFEDKRRLAWWIMEGYATYSLIQRTFAGGIVYPCTAMEKIFRIQETQE